MTLLVEQRGAGKVRGLIRAERAGTEQETGQRVPVPGMLAATLSRAHWVGAWVGSPALRGPSEAAMGEQVLRDDWGPALSRKPRVQVLPPSFFLPGFP